MSVLCVQSCFSKKKKKCVQSYVSVLCVQSYHQRVWSFPTPVITTITHVSMLHWLLTLANRGGARGLRGQLPLAPWILWTILRYFTLIKKKKTLTLIHVQTLNTKKVGKQIFSPYQIISLFHKIYYFY